MTVRPAEAADRSAIARLRWRWRTEEAGEEGPAEHLFAEALAGWLSEHEATHLAWVAEPQGVPAGIVFLCIVDRIPGPGRWSRCAGVLQSLYVAPEHRGGGLGTQLVDAVLDEARRRELDYVSVHPTERSVPLYRRAGFRENARTLEIDLRPRHG